jgi:hypothetical protein
MRVTTLSLVFLLGKQVHQVDGFTSTSTNRYTSLTNTNTQQRNRNEYYGTHESYQFHLQSSSESLSDMEDRVENQLDKDQPLETNALQHSYIAPTKTDSSSGTYNLQEKGMHGEDAEMRQRQDKINEILEEEDKVWREERRRKQMGKFADVETQEDWERLRNEEKQTLDKGKLFRLCIVHEMFQIIKGFCREKHRLGHCHYFLFSD